MIYVQQTFVYTIPFFTVLVHFTDKLIKVEKNCTIFLSVSVSCLHPVDLFVLVFTMVIGTLRNQELQNIFIRTKIRISYNHCLRGKIFN